MAIYLLPLVAQHFLAQVQVQVQVKVQALTLCGAALGRKRSKAFGDLGRSIACTWKIGAAMNFLNLQTGTRLRRGDTRSEQVGTDRQRLMPDDRARRNN